MQKTQEFSFRPWVRNIPWSKKWQPAQVFLPGKFHGQRSLADCSPWDHGGLDMMEHMHTSDIGAVTSVNWLKSEDPGIPNLHLNNHFPSQMWFWYVKEERHLPLCIFNSLKGWLCGSQQTVENSSRDGNTRPPDLPLEKSVCRLGSNS